MCVQNAMRDGQKPAREDMDSALRAKLFTGTNRASQNVVQEGQIALHNMPPQFAGPVDTSTANTLGQNGLTCLLTGSGQAPATPLNLIERLQSLQSLQCLQSLQSLQSLQFAGSPSGQPRLLVPMTSNLNLYSAQTPNQPLSGAANTSFQQHQQLPASILPAQGCWTSGVQSALRPDFFLLLTQQTQQNAPNPYIEMAFSPSGSSSRDMIHAQKATKCATYEACSRRKPSTHIARQSVRPQDPFCCCLYAMWRILLSVCMPTHEAHCAWQGGGGGGGGGSQFGGSQFPSFLKEMEQAGVVTLRTDNSDAPAELQGESPPSCACIAITNLRSKGGDCNPRACRYCWMDGEGHDRMERPSCGVVYEEQDWPGLQEEFFQPNASPSRILSDQGARQTSALGKASALRSERFLIMEMRASRKQAGVAMGWTLIAMNFAGTNAPPYHS